MDNLKGKMLYSTIYKDPWEMTRKKKFPWPSGGNTHHIGMDTYNLTRLVCEQALEHCTCQFMQTGKMLQATIFKEVLIYYTGGALPLQTTLAGD